MARDEWDGTALPLDVLRIRDRGTYVEVPQEAFEAMGEMVVLSPELRDRVAVITWDMEDGRIFTFQPDRPDMLEAKKEVARRRMFGDS